MKLQELINQLKKLQKEHGNLRVTRHEYGGIGVVDHNGAQVRHIRQKRNREYKTYYVSVKSDISIEKVIGI